MGPYDGNPASLDPLPPVAAGQNYVRYMGGADAIINSAQAAYAAGNYRWVVPQGLALARLTPQKHQRNNRKACPGVQQERIIKCDQARLSQCLTT